MVEDRMEEDREEKTLAARHTCCQSFPQPSKQSHDSCGLHVRLRAFRFVSTCVYVCARVPAGVFV